MVYFSSKAWIVEVGIVDWIGLASSVGLPNPFEYQPWKIQEFLAFLVNTLDLPYPLTPSYFFT